MVLKRINRYELKYMVHASHYPRLVDDLLNFMSPDPYGDHDGFYRIVSLYYDGPKYPCYRSKIEGINVRKKVRLRIYPGDDIEATTQGCVEIKQRINRTVQKQRLFLPLDQCVDLLEGDATPELTDPRDVKAASNMQFLVRAMGLVPACIVSYRRQAFQGGRYESGMRLTFDMDLTGRVDALRVNEAARNFHFIPLDWLIMEVKVNERIPGWVTSLLAKHECQLRRVSKYCLALADGLHRREFQMKHKESFLWTN